MKGIKVYEGIGIGQAYILVDINLPSRVSQELIHEEERNAEYERFQSALAISVSALEELETHTRETVGEEEAMIFEAHLMMIQDPTLLDPIKREIMKNGLNAPYAVLKTRNQIVGQFMAIEDEYIRARAQDVQDVSDKLLQMLLGVEPVKLELINEPSVVFAKDLKPSETVMLNDYVIGIVLEEGSVTSHAAIVAKAKGIPTLVGVKGACDEVKSGVQVILDATNNLVIVTPDQETIAQYNKALQVQKAETERLASLKTLEAKTKDGHCVKLFGNVGSLQETHWVKDNGGTGVGLLRTELIYMDNEHFPTEEEQFGYYKEIVETLPEEVIIRTLDIGGDKMLPYYTFEHEMNPFLGVRAIRFCLNNEALFITQLRAILRSSTFGKVKIMFPMISCLEELRAAKVVLEKAKDQLRNEGIAFDEHIAVGIMVEIPAAAISADLFAEEVDFFSIGTNDLCQYTSAVDRMNTGITHLYQPLHPSILRLIEMTIAAGKAHNVEVGVCGEMASDPDMALLLVGMGVDELSMSASMISKVKDKLIHSNFEALQTLVQQVKKTKTAEDALAVLRRK